jgi:NUMOD1 domain
VNNKPFDTITEASSFIGTTRSTIINILDRNIAMSKRFYCFSKELDEKELNVLKIKGKIRNPISSLSKPIWVYTLENEQFNILNGKPFQSQQEMLRSLKLKRARTVNKYKDSGINFRGYYFFSNKLSDEELNKLKKNLYAKPSKNSMLVWGYKDNELINNRPFLSITSAGKELNLNRKLIRKYLDSNITYNGYLFSSCPKEQEIN